MKNDLSIKLTIWGATLFLSGAIMLYSFINVGIFFMLIGSIIGILSLSNKNG